MRRQAIPAILLSVCLSSAAFAGPSASFAPYEDPEAVSLQTLLAAQQTLDVAHYNIRSEHFHEALKTLKARGVRIRIVVDAKNARNAWNTLDDTLEAEGFALKRYENTGHSYAIMHHKFCVIDGRQVLTGSFNWNHTAQLANDENLVSIDEVGIVAAYQTEFAELWGEQPEAPGVGQGANGSRVYFSPEDRPRNAILDAIRGAQRRVLVAMFSFRDRDVAKALADAAQRGVEVVIVTEKKQADSTGEDERVKSAGGRVIVGANTGATHSAMHHKFAIVDDSEVITGACNWTWTAFTHSNEDVLFVRDAAFVRRYLDAFAALVARYDAANYRPADFLVQKPEADVALHVVMPNTGVGDRVVVVGEDPALGAWDPAQGVELRTEDGIYPNWSGHVRLPAGASTRCKAVLIRPDGTVRWELGQDRRIEVDAAGTNPYVSLEFRDEIEVQITVDHPTLPAGRTLAIVGAHPALGGWDPSRAVPLVPDVTTPGRYTLSVRLPGRSLQACKLVEVRASDQKVLWEAGQDRNLTLHDQAQPQAVHLAARGPAPDPAAPVSSTVTAAPTASSTAGASTAAPSSTNP